jgi:hypothetical protein
MLMARSSVLTKRVEMMTTEFREQQSAFDASTAFRVAPGFHAMALASQLPRRERWVLLLLDGRRTVAYLARLTQRGELDIAHTLAEFLQWGYIEPANAVAYTTAHYESRHTHQ